MSRYTAVPASTGRKYACGVLPNARCNAPAATCPTVNRARIPADPFSPTPLARTKLPPSSTYSKYCPSRSCSKSSHQIHPGCGTAHSADPGGGGGGGTVIADVPLCPSLVAVIVADPAPTPVTNPLPFIVAAAVLLLPHATTRPASGLPLASLGVAVSCTVCPTVTFADAGLTLTDATGTIATVMAAVPLCPSLVAMIAADPAPTPVTSPPPSTAAAALLLLPPTTTRAASGLPAAALGVASSA